MSSKKLGGEKKTSESDFIASCNQEKSKVRDYAAEQKLLDETIASFPSEFGLRGFPNKRFRLAGKFAHFWSEGEMQLVVQTQMTPDEQKKYGLLEWADFGRNTPEHVRKEMVA